MGHEKGIERRKHARREVLETFQVFLVIPKAGLRKIHLRDVSEGGLSFEAEAEDRLDDGDVVDCYFHINPSLRLPLSFKVAHVTESDDGTKRVGCEFNDRSTQGYKAFISFLSLLDELAAFLGQ